MHLVLLFVTFKPGISVRKYPAVIPHSLINKYVNVSVINNLFSIIIT